MEKINKLHQRLNLNKLRSNSSFMCIKKKTKFKWKTIYFSIRMLAGLLLLLFYFDNESSQVERELWQSFGFVIWAAHVWCACTRRAAASSSYLVQYCLVAYNEWWFKKVFILTFANEIRGHNWIIWLDILIPTYTLSIHSLSSDFSPSSL